MCVCVCISCRDHYSITGQVFRPQGGFYENEKDVKLTIIMLRSDLCIYTCMHNTCDCVCAVRVYVCVCVRTYNSVHGPLFANHC